MMEPFRDSEPFIHRLLSRFCEPSDKRPAALEAISFLLMMLSFTLDS